MKLFLTTFFISIFSLSFGQSTSNFQNDLNRILVRHYTPAQWELIGEHSPEVYGAINYYFKESFEVEMANCSECTVDYEVLYNIDLFDVYAQESKRLDDVNFTFDYKQYTITLLSKDVVYSQLQGLAPSDLINYIAPRDFPTFELTNDDYKEYLKYKERVYAWAKDFPEQYRAMTNSENFVKISIRDFSELAVERKSLVLNHADGYLIID